MAVLFKRLLPYWCASAVVFYLLPWMMTNPGMAMLLMMVIIPILTLVCALSCGMKLGFQWYYALVVAALFSPTVWIYYNGSAAVYIAIYGAAALLGNLIGGLVYKRKYTGYKRRK